MHASAVKEVDGALHAEEPSFRHSNTERERPYERVTLIQERVLAPGW